MLHYLNIKNFALIEDIEIDLEKGLTIITGETGAGKSIILGAISLLTGSRADRSMLKNDSKKCIIEASFHLGNLNLKDLFDQYDLEYNDETIIRREFNKDGKSRVFINDSPAVLLHLREVMNRILDVHSQHENLDLNKKNYQLTALDIMAGNKDTLVKYKKEYKEYLDALKTLEELRSASLKLRENTEYLSFQLNELNDASLSDGEQEELETELDLLNHAEEIKSNFHVIDSIFNGSEASPVDSVSQINNLVRKTKEHFKDMEEVAQRMENLLIELEDVRRELERYSERASYNPERLQIVQDRLSLLYQLQQKYRVNTVTELIDKAESLREELEDIEGIDDRLGEAQQSFDECEKRVTEMVDVLTNNRKYVRDELESNILSSLLLLGMKNSQFSVDIKKKDKISENGMDDVEFLFSANKGVDPKAIGKVASGGEISRLMLSIKALLTTKSELPTIIFDEIDTGISGIIADKMGKIIRDMSRNTQVIAITHLPQIAAMGDRHLVVYKDEEGEKSRTKIKELTGEERTMEIARLLSGEEISQEALNNAKVLLSVTV